MTFRRRQALLAFYSIALVTANLRWLAALVDYAWRNPTASHIPLVPFVVAALVFGERSEIFKVNAMGSAFRRAPDAGGGSDARGGPNAGIRG